MITQKEKQWWNRFTKILNEMPSSLEILVGAYGEIALARRGTAKKSLDTVGSMDNLSCLDVKDWRGSGVENNEGSF